MSAKNEGTLSKSVASSLDVAARNLDLLDTLLTKTGPVASLIELGQWLQLECVSKDSLARLLTEARDIARPNVNGVQFHQKVLSAPPVTENWPLAVKQSGALGRRLMGDPNLDWMVSTTAVLMHFHKERFISQALCMMIAQESNEKAERKMDKFELRYSMDRIEIKAVVDKVITSIWYNVVNSGNTTQQLPERLRKVCSRGHNLNADQFGEVTHCLKKHTGDIIVESKHLLNNLTLWLIHHFRGTLIVTVSGKVLLEEDLRTPDQQLSRTLELKILKFCDESQDCKDEEYVFRIYDSMRGSVDEFLSGIYPSGSQQPQEPLIRRPLYDIQKSYDIKLNLLSDSVQRDARKRSQALVRWLMELPIAGRQEASDFSLAIADLEPSRPASTSDSRLGDVFGRSPSILNFNWGFLDATVYAPPELDNSSHSDMDITYGSPVEDGNLGERRSDDDLAFQGREYSDEDILAYLPVLRDLVKKSKQECSCHDCHGSRAFGDDAGTSMNSFTIPPGCLSQYAVNYVLLQVAHAIADSFGAPDASGNRNAKNILAAVLKALFRILRDCEVSWDTWFNLAACVDLGCPFQETVMDIEFTGTAYAALQYGNLAVMAPWLNVTKPLSLKRCFRYDRFEGVLGTLEEDQGTNVYCGIQERWAILQTEHVEDTSGYSRRFEKVTEPLASRIQLRPDDSTCDTRVVIVQAADTVYRLLMRAVSDTIRRGIDPAAAMIHLIKSPPALECKHQTSWTSHQPTEVLDVVKLHSFDDLVGYWQNSDTSTAANEGAEGLTYHITSLLDSDAKLNIARSLAVNDLTLVNYGRCCLRCALEQARTMPMPEDLALVNDINNIKERYIINVRLDSKQMIPSGKRKVREG